MTGYVYMIDDGEGCVKVGWAMDPSRRLSELNVSTTRHLRLIGAARGTRDHERQIHEIMKPWHVRGEWFRKEGHVLLFLDHLPKWPERTPKEPQPHTEGLRRAIEIAGSQSALARKIGRRQQDVYHWLHRSKVGVEAEAVLAVEAATGVSRTELRPDLYGFWVFQ